MKKPLLIIVLVVLLIAVSLWLVIASLSRPEETPPPENVPEFPTGGGGPVAGPSGTLTYTTAGGSVAVADFRRSPGARSIGSGNYLIEPSAAPGMLKPYQLLFFEYDGSFLISLAAEPLGAVRQEAERDLLSRLGVSESEACGLPIMVTVPSDISGEYAGRDLGLSFCPGGVPLP